jgi:uncharacterized membrane protein
MSVLVVFLATLTSAAVVWALVVRWRHYRLAERPLGQVPLARRIVIGIGAVLAGFGAYFAGEVIANKSRLLLGFLTASLAVVVLISAGLLKRR